MGILPAAPDGRRAAVVHERDLPMRPFPVAEGSASVREPIGPATDCRQLIQRVIRLDPRARTRELRNETSEDILYVSAGAVVATVDGRLFQLQAGSALYAPPGSAYLLEAKDKGTELVSVLSPPPGAPAPAASPNPPATTAEAEQPPLPAGGDRTFKLMIDPRFGCRNVTQFVGFIDRSRAPAHTHTYEEVIYILAGEGVVHIDERRAPISAGTSIFLPPGVPHCLENQSDEVLRLLGVFSPPGSPANKDTMAPGPS